MREKTEIRTRNRESQEQSRVVVTSLFLSLKPRNHCPTSPSDMMKKNYGVCGVGLGIVAEMEKSGEIPATRALFLQNIWRSNPIPVNKPKMGNLDFSSPSSSSSSSSESDQEYMTYVTRRWEERPNKQLPTRIVYSDKKNQMGEVERQRLEKSVKKSSLFDITPARYSPPPASSDFLSSCHLCKKKLHGKDIYIYRGEKGFCSPECRFKQIVMEKREERSSRPSSLSSGYSSTGGRIIFYPEILAT